MKIPSVSHLLDAQFSVNEKSVASDLANPALSARSPVEVTPASEIPAANSAGWETQQQAGRFLDVSV